MRKQQVDHVLRAAGRITGDKQFIIIGSQALHGTYPDLPDEIVRSAQVDLVAGKAGARTEWLNAIGYLSPFHESFGYYADTVDASTAILAKGWKARRAVLERMACYAERQLASGERLASITRHMLGLYAGEPGAREYRRLLSEGARAPGADASLLRIAAERAALAAPV